MTIATVGATARTVPAVRAAQKQPDRVAREAIEPSNVRLVTAARSHRCDRIVELSTGQLRVRLVEALQLYVAAMGYPQATTHQRAPMWQAHMLREGWRCVGAFNATDELIGVGYGYLGTAGQWWHEQVRQGLLGTHPIADVDEWMTDYFELTELHVRPDSQGAGLGEQILRRLLVDPPSDKVLLSTPEGPTRAWKLYRRVGFVDVLRRYRFSGDPRPFAVLGRHLPLDPPQR